MGELALLFAIAASAIAWVNHRRVLDIAVARARQACVAANVQFLDDTAALGRIRLRRDGAGVLRLYRRFTFEYATPSDHRRHGEVIILGQQPLVIELEDQAIIDGP